MEPSESKTIDEEQLQQPLAEELPSPPPVAPLDDDEEDDNAKDKDKGKDNDEEKEHQEKENLSESLLVDEIPASRSYRYLLVFFIILIVAVLIGYALEWSQQMNSFKFRMEQVRQRLQTLSVDDFIPA